MEKPNHTEEGKTLKRKKNKTIIIILSILAFILLISGVFFGAYYLSVGKSSNSYEGSIRTYIDNINNINLSSSVFIKGQTIDVEKLRKDLPSKTDELLKLKNKLQNIIPTDKYKNDQENLLNGLDKNILMFRQITLILSNPNSNELDKAGSDLLKYRDDCESLYSQVNIGKTKPSITDQGKTLINNTSSYVNELARAHKDSEIIKNQDMDFINSMEGLIAKFMPIKVDYSAQISKAREQGSNFDGLILVINNNKDTLDSLSQEFANITVPSKALSCYKAFSKSTDDYNSYLQSILYSIKNESLSGKNLTSSKLDELYASPTAKFNDVIKDYSDFLKAYADFKDVVIK